MPMRGELSIPAMRAGRAVPAVDLGWHRALDALRSPELRVVIVISAIGLLLAFCLTQLLPLADDVAMFLAQSS
jgi:hypothetical protein